ncbi:hypothetical protein [Capillibacterium thermochitinicola]|uniref:Uncharacterized protein n=1 Tax=Capillibacterium thermochitinicola TaxID=2699427 RepID=A0A8J6I1E0_9FIRM|nr:hypothetical protein [Capillibacterium thermochitinicola]MBA2133208.1 hypothetical protein [Capillibacterium thermochitinicola]
MRIKRLMIKALGPLRDWEHTFAPSWAEVPYTEQETEETVIEAIRAVLYGFPPHQNVRKQQLIPPTGKEDCSAAMWIETKSGTFLLGRNFTRESLEVFKLETKGLFPLSSMALMDLLLQELKVLNPLDFAVIGVFQNTDFTLDQNAPLVREHIRKVQSHERLPVLLSQAGNETRTHGQEIDLATINELLVKLDRLEKEKQRLIEEEQNYAAYEKFLSPTGEDLLALTTREYTAATLETSFYEEQIRKEMETRAILKKEEETLRQKIAAFDPTIYTPETERRVNRLLAQRAELNRLLQAMEELLEQNSRKGVWSRFGGKEREEEIKRRISELLQKLGRIREELKVLLKNKNPEDFLREMALLEQYRKDLACLQRPTILEDQNLDLWWEELERARQKEERLRQKREQLLALAGREDLAAVQVKVQKLSVIKHQRQQVEEELAAFLAELDQATPAEARAYLVELKQKREAEAVMKKNADLGEGELTALYTIYRDAGRFLSGLTEGKGQGLKPRLEGNLLRFSVRTADGDWCPAEEVSFSRPDLPDLAFRLALAKAVWADTQPLLLFDALAPWLTPKAAAAFCDLLHEGFRGGQIIIRVR